MIRRLVWLVMSGLVAAAPAAGAVNPILTALPNNTWIRLDRGGLSAPSGVLAYSGMSFDAQHRKLVLFGGGHADYWGNEIWAFDADLLTWTRMYAPDPQAAYSGTYVKSSYPGALFYPDPNEPLSEARPMSRHSYDAVEYVDHLNQTIIFRGYTYDAIWGYTEHYNPNDTWLYSLDTNKWTWKNVAQLPEPGGGGHSSAYDPESRLVFSLGSNDATYSYSPDTDTWTRLMGHTGSNALVGIETVMAYSSAQRKKIYLFGSSYPTTNELWEFDIPARSWRLLNPGGATPTARGAYGLVYDSVNDVLIAFGGQGPNVGGSTNETYIYNIGLNTWTRQSPVTGGPTTINAQTYGRFKYDPVSNVAFLVTVGPNWVIETWAYRYKSGTPAPPDVIPPNPPGNVVTK